jgi:hypothetical protein
LSQQHRLLAAFPPNIPAKHPVHLLIRVPRSVLRPHHLRFPQRLLAVPPPLIPRLSQRPSPALFHRLRHQRLHRLVQVWFQQRKLLVAFLPHTLLPHPANLLIRVPRLVLQQYLVQSLPHTQAALPAKSQVRYQHLPQVMPQAPSLRSSPRRHLLRFPLGLPPWHLQVNPVCTPVDNPQRLLLPYPQPSLAWLPVMSRPPKHQLDPLSRDPASLPWSPPV